MYLSGHHGNRDLGYCLKKDMASENQLRAPWD